MGYPAESLANLLTSRDSHASFMVFILFFRL